jgi:hypothetical protein
MKTLIGVAVLASILSGCNQENSQIPATTNTPAPTITATPGPTSASPSASVFTQHDSVGEFYVDYTGPKRPSLNAINAGGRFVTSSQQFILDAQMAGPINSGDQNYYVWGIQRGTAVSSPFADEPNVLFDAVVSAAVSPAGVVSATVNLLNGAPAQTVTAVLTAPDTIEVTIPVADLPMAASLTPANYLWNLWPRSGVGGASAAQVASFIPENAVAPFTSTLY